jgi:hypothetical protein
MRFAGAFTNLLNHSVFVPPTNVTASSFGIVQSVQATENSGNRTGTTLASAGFRIRPHQQGSSARSFAERVGESLQRS